MIGIPLKGNVKDFSLPKILLYLNRNRKTGTLVVKTSSFTKKIYLDKGDTIFASSSYEDDRLGEMLIKAGKITIAQYEESVELLKTKGKRQGAILVELGYLTPKDLFWGVKYQVREIVYSLFPLEDAEYEFLEGEIPANEVITLKMSMANLIYDGVKKISNLIRMKNEMPDMNSVIKLSTDPISLFQDIEFSPQDQKMLSMIDGKKTIKELTNIFPAGSYEALKSLYALWSIGIIEEKEKIIEKPEETVTVEDILKPVPEEEGEFIKNVDEMYSKLDRLGADELLEIDENSDLETIKKNYYRLAKEFHPDRYFSATDPAIKDKLTAIFDAISQGYTLLKDDDARREYFSSLLKFQKEDDLNPQNAEEQFKRGVDEFKKGNFWGATDAFKWAIKLNPEKAKYWSHLSLAFSKMEKRLKDAEEALLRAIKIEPYNADHYVNLGHIYLMAGMKKRAFSQFEKAIKLDPENAKATKGLKQVEA